MAFALVLAAAGAPSEPWQSQSLHPEPLRLAAFGPQPLPLYAHSLASGEIRQEDNSSLHTVLILCPPGVSEYYVGSIFLIWGVHL